MVELVVLWDELSRLRVELSGLLVVLLAHALVGVLQAFLRKLAVLNVVLAILRTTTRTDSATRFQMAI